MHSQRARRLTIAAVTSVALTMGIAAPALATPADQSRNLAKLKAQWTAMPKPDRRAVCRGYRSAPDQLTTLTVLQLWGQPANRQGMTQGEWRTVVGKYLTWACSGPGHTPRG